MKQYNNTKGLKGIRNLLKQFNESVLTPWQRDLLRERLLILSWYDRNGRNKAATAKEFETSRGHIHKLVKARKEEGLGGLIPKTTGPLLKRGFELSSEEKLEIEKFAEMFPDWGHKKLHVFLHKHSKSTIYRYLSSKDMLVRNRCPGYHKKPKPRSAWRIERKRLPKDYPAEKPGDLVVLDSIVEFIGSNFQKVYFITCVDIATRIGFASVTKFHNSKAAKALLEKMEEVLQTNIKAVLTDNGGEFLAHFHKACKKQGIEHFFSRPRTPKDNAIAERFNLTLQRHLYWRVDLTSSVYKINEVLADWLIEYNCLRPHESLNMRPPAAQYFHLFYSPRSQGVYLKLWNRTSI
ncbi:DDE-type integrase/transposase/recombinase [Patescibacteria group bacterium]|nr:DDE-type integrase/transposase/recombinase [Patescibacteria group bacterium]